MITPVMIRSLPLERSARAAETRTGEPWPRN